MVPEVVSRVPEQLDERDQGSPGVRAVDKEALEENLRHDLPELVVFDLRKEIKHQRAKPVCVSVGIA